MFRSRRATAGFALLVWASFAPAVGAQEIVPGGWSPQVGFQSFPAPGSFGTQPAYRDFVPNLSAAAAPQVVHALIPVADVVRRGTRKRPRR